MKELKEFASLVHKRTKRDYLSRVTEFPKAKAAAIAKRFDQEYWDGDRRVGYGGFNYDGRWRQAAEAMIKTYDLKPGMKVLDVGCGKAFLLYELTQLVPGIKVQGIDISEYAINHAKEEVRPFLKVGGAEKLPYSIGEFDLVLSITTLHNLPCYGLDLALREMMRVSKNHQYLCVESYRNEEEKVNLMYWQLTCEMFCSPKEWLWWFERTGYQGDYEFIYFE